MKTYQEQLKARTMNKIYGIWFVQRVLPVLSLEATVLVSAVWFAQNFMKFGHIVNNVIWRLNHHPAAKLADFGVATLFNTEFMLLAVLIGAVAAGSLMARDVTRLTRGLSGNFSTGRRVT